MLCGSSPHAILCLPVRPARRRAEVQSLHRALAIVQVVGLTDAEGTLQVPVGWLVSPPPATPASFHDQLTAGDAIDLYHEEGWWAGKVLAGVKQDGSYKVRTHGLPLPHATCSHTAELLS